MNKTLVDLLFILFWSAILLLVSANSMYLWELRNVLPLELLTAGFGFLASSLLLFIITLPER
ncbi:MAG: hypothetical protein D6791_02920 [Chloroflexi bacterium]|nr:MAG: hypothetical protein D6791_02920 [Chloroflexota bacterium]